MNGLTAWIADRMLLLAQEGGGAGAPAAAPGAGQQTPFFANPLFLLAIAFFLFYFIVIRPQSRERQRQEREREEKLKNIKKNDKVVTIGGIYGVVSHVEPDKNELVLRVDESNNTRIRVTRNSIHEVLKDEASDGSPSK